MNQAEQPKPVDPAEHHAGIGAMREVFPTLVEAQARVDELRMMDLDGEVTRHPGGYLVLAW
jgi:hypothetical protein